MVWRWASGLASDLTRCVTRGGPPTLSGSRLRNGLQPQQPPASPTLGLGGGRPASRLSPSPERRLLPWPPAPLWKPRGCGMDGSTRAADTPPAPTQPGASWRRVGTGSPPAAPGPLVSGSENHGLFRLQSDGLGPESNRTGAFYCAGALVFSHLNKINSYV